MNKQNNGLEEVPTCLESPESTPRTERVYHVGLYVRMYVCSTIDRRIPGYETRHVTIKLSIEANCVSINPFVAYAFFPTFTAIQHKNRYLRHSSYSQLSYVPG